MSDPKHIADSFNNLFANIGKKQEKEIPTVNRNSLEYLPRPLSNSFYIFPTTSSETSRRRYS